MYKSCLSKPYSAIAGTATKHMLHLAAYPLHFITPWTPLLIEVHGLILQLHAMPVRLALALTAARHRRLHVLARAISMSTAHDQTLSLQPTSAFTLIRRLGASLTIQAVAFGGCAVAANG